MRKFLLLLVLAVMPVLAFTVEAPAATPKPTEQQLLIKKKKAEEARKAAEAREAKEKKAAEARKAKEKKAAEIRRAKEKQVAETRKREQRLALEKKQRERKAQAAAQRRDCGGFLECLLNKPRRGVQTASASATARDMPTGEDIRWAPATGYAPGSIVVKTPERALYLVTGDGKARRYKVGVGKEGFQWAGTSTIVQKAEWPTWRPPQAMIKREAAKGHMLPAEMEGGPGNPLGARALYIGGSIYRIHGTNAPGSIGGAVSSGCIRMMNSDVIDLYERVKLGAKVYVTQ